jgi:hypothetical protein
LLVWVRMIPALGAGYVNLLLAFMAACVAAMISWRWVELPTRRLAVTDKRLLWGVGAGVMAVCMLAAWLVMVNGGGRASTSWARMLMQSSQQVHPMQVACLRNAQEISPLRWDGCVADAQDRVGTVADMQSYDVLVWGDSQADQWMPALREITRRKGLRIREVAQNQCAPVLADDVVDHEPCNQFNHTVWQEIMQHPRLQWVVLGGMWREYKDGGGYYDFRLNGQSVTIAQALQDVVHKLRARGVKVLVMGQIPSFITLDGYDICIEYLATRRDTSRCLVPSNMFAFQSTDAMLRALERDGVVVWLPSQVLCDAQQCAIVDDNGLYYRDGGHLSVHGAWSLLPALQRIWTP